LASGGAQQVPVCVSVQSADAACAKLALPAVWQPFIHEGNTMSNKSNASTNSAAKNAAIHAANITSQDAIALLTADHREVSEMFKQFEELGDRAKASKQKLVEKICTSLIAHTQIEEEIFYPAIREQKQIKDADDMVDEALVEHQAAKDLIRQLQEANPDDDLYDAKVKVLGEEIEHHVKEEEEEMFKEARKSGLDLKALGQEMAQRKQEILSTL
jgi:hemerythrin-like domain-containing protein